jgi:hypothetical protein
LRATVFLSLEAYIHDTTRPSANRIVSLAATEKLLSLVGELADDVSRRHYTLHGAY